MTPIDSRPLPKSLLRYLDETTDDEDRAPLTVHGSQSVADRLCDGAEYIARSLAHGRHLLGLGMVVMLLYLAIEIGSAFLPHGVVARVLGGGQ